MASSEQRRQKKAIKQRTRRKEYERQRAIRQNEGALAIFRRTVQYPVLQCFRNDNLFSEGIGGIHISRQLPSRQVAFAVFLVDIWCLGVKDVFGRICPQPEYEEFLLTSRSRQQVVPIAPEYARKLVEGSVAFAKRVGLSPHRDYASFAAIFGNIDASRCTEAFEFGNQGKPYYVAGPHDDLQRQQEICSILRSTVGPNNFHYLLAGRYGEIESLLEDSD